MNTTKAQRIESSKNICNTLRAMRSFPTISHLKIATDAIDMIIEEIPFLVAEYEGIITELESRVYQE